MLAEMEDALDTEELFHFVTALRGGDFSVRLSVSGSGRASEIALNLNRFAEQMGAFTAEISRVCTEIGVEGRLGPQAELFLPPGPWRNCLEAVNTMAFALTGQIRDLNRTAAKMAHGVYTRKVTTDCSGEMLELKNSLNEACRRDQESKGGNSEHVVGQA